MSGSGKKNKRGCRNRLDLVGTHSQSGNEESMEWSQMQGHFKTIQRIRNTLKMWVSEKNSTRVRNAGSQMPRGSDSGSRCEWTQEQIPVEK